MGDLECAFEGGVGVNEIFSASSSSILRGGKRSFVSVWILRSDAIRSLSC